MAIPSKVQGAGNNSTAQNVFRITFSQALSAPPTLEAWDDSTLATTTKEMFAGTTVNGNKPYLSGVATTDVAPASAWKPTVAAAGGAVANRLKGTTNFVNLSVAAPGLGGIVRFNVVWELPSDATVPATSTMNGVLVVRYAFSGTAPTLTWAFNDSSAGGTELTPSWTTLTSGAAGNFIRPADANSVSGTYLFTKPATGTVDSGAVWVSAT